MGVRVDGLVSNNAVDITSIAGQNVGERQTGQNGSLSPGFYTASATVVLKAGTFNGAEFLLALTAASSTRDTISRSD